MFGLVVLLFLVIFVSVTAFWPYISISILLLTYKQFLIFSGIGIITSIILGTIVTREQDGPEMFFTPIGSGFLFGFLIGTFYYFG